MLKKSINLNGLLAIFLFFSFISCDDSLTELGNAVLPDGDNIVVKTDTITDFRFKTINNNKLYTANNYNPLVGEITHDFFGKTKSVWVGQFLFNQLYYKYIDFKEIKDAYLVLVIDTVLGYKYTSDLEFSIYELNTSGSKTGFSDSTLYFANMDYEDFYDKKLITTKQVQLRNLDAESYVESNEEIIHNVLRIPLPKAFINKLYGFHENEFEKYFNDTLYSATDSSIYALTYNDSALVEGFKDYMGGLAIESKIIGPLTDGQGGALLKLLMNSVYSRIEVNYLSEDTVDIERTFEYTFVPKDVFNYKSIDYKKSRNCISYSMYSNDFDGYGIQEYIDQESDSLIFVNSLLGLRSQVEFLGADSLLEADKVMINRAEFTIDNIRPEAFTGFETTDNFLWCADSNKYYVEESSKYYLYYEDNIFKTDGGRSKTTYTLNMPHLLKDYIESGEDNLFYLNPAYPTGSLVTVNDELKIQNTIINAYSYNFEILNPRSAKLIITYTVRK